MREITHQTSYIFNVLDDFIDLEGETLPGGYMKMYQGARRLSRNYPTALNLFLFDRPLSEFVTSRRRQLVCS